MNPIRNVVIVGGGTAGWLTAGIIAAKHRSRMATGFTVTLVESPTTPIIGVGEGTWPTLRTTLSKMGVSETDFFRECDAAFKQGALFKSWTTGAADDSYYHPLMLPQGFAQLSLVPHWLLQRDGESFCDAVCPQGRICDDGLAPKTIATPEYDALANYSYHLDAGKFAGFLQRHCCEKLDVRHVKADARDVRLAENGDIAAIVTEQVGEIEGDLFVDCTGFRSLLLGGALGVPFKDCSDVLFCDAALAVQVPYAEEDSPIASHTISTAQSAGWIWDVGLPTRRGTGHVYSTAHISDDEAERELRAYLGSAGKDSRDVLETQLRGGGTGGRLPRAARILGDRAHRAFRQTDRGTAAGMSRSDGYRRGALQRDHALSVGPDHRFPQAPLRAHQARGQRLLARQCPS
jgi:tryptophan halogenase